MAPGGAAAGHAEWGSEVQYGVCAEAAVWVSDGEIEGREYPVCRGGG